MNLILKRVAINAAPATACPCWVAALHHEVFDYSVEYGPVVVAASCQSLEVLTCARCMLVVEF